MLFRDFGLVWPHCISSNPTSTSSIHHVISVFDCPTCPFSRQPRYPTAHIMLIGPSACSVFPTVSSDHARWLRHRSAEISYCFALPDFLFFLSCNAAPLLFFKSPLIASHLKSIIFTLQTQLQGTTLHVFSVYVHVYLDYLHGYKSVHTLLVRVLFGYVFWEWMEGGCDVLWSNGSSTVCLRVCARGWPVTEELGKGVMYFKIPNVLDRSDHVPLVRKTAEKKVKRRERWGKEWYAGRWKCRVEEKEDKCD